MGSLQSAPMEAASPARLYATAGRRPAPRRSASSASSTAPPSARPASVEAALGVLRVNAWLNLPPRRSPGRSACSLAGYASRRYALWRRRSSTPCSRSGASRSAAATRSSASSRHRRRRRCDLALGLLGLHAATREPRIARRSDRERLRAASAGRRARALRPLSPLLPAAAAQLEQDQGAGGDPAGADGDHRAHPVARVAQRPQLALGELLGPVGELLGGRLGDRRRGCPRPGRRAAPAARSGAARRPAAARRPRCCRSAFARLTHRSSPPAAA